MEKKLLKDMAEVSSCFAIRKPNKDKIGQSDVPVIQPSNIKESDEIDCQNLLRVPTPYELERYLIKPGDILLNMRGKTHKAVCCSRPPDGIIASSQFCRIRVIDSSLVPEFLAWILNQEKAQEYFARIESGSAIRELRITEVRMMPLSSRLPSIERQKNYVELAESVKNENEILGKIIRNNNSIIKSVYNRDFGLED